jgi:hypothetical protein
MRYEYDEQDEDGAPGSGFTALACAVLRLAVSDLRGDGENRASARKFFSGEWFETLATATGLDADAARERLGGRGVL